MKNYLFLLLSLICFASAASAMVPPTFDVEVSLDHCPEHRIQPSLELEIYYTVGTSLSLIPANVITLSENNTSNTATAVLRFPTNMASTPFNIVARCVDTGEFSDYSNKLGVSNCNFIATIDTDRDGIANNLEDTDCNNLFTAQDFSNFENVDTDGDGVRDLSEVFAGADPKNTGSSLVPLVFSSAPYDPNLDGESNPIAWRPSIGNFYVKDASGPGRTLSVKLGRSGDTPITYQPDGAISDLGVIRIESSGFLNWYLRGPGFSRTNGARETSFSLGAAGDNLVFGPFEKPGVTNPAIARLFDSYWVFLIKLSNGTLRYQAWGINGDIPKPQDYDGDGIFDIAVFRPSVLKTFIINSSNNSISVIEFGSHTADLSVRGDYTQDGKADLAFWEPITGVFFTLKSNLGFNPAEGALMNPLYYEQLQLGLYNVHTPLNWNKRAGRIVYTVSDRANGFRHYRLNNLPSSPVTSEQWGIAGDHLG